MKVVAPGQIAGWMDSECSFSFGGQRWNYELHPMAPFFVVGSVCVSSHFVRPKNEWRFSIPDAPVNMFPGTSVLNAAFSTAMARRCKKELCWRDTSKRESLMTRMVRPGVDYDTLELYKRKRRCRLTGGPYPCQSIMAQVPSKASGEWRMSASVNQPTGMKTAVPFRNTVCYISCKDDNSLRWLLTVMVRQAQKSKAQQRHLSHGIGQTRRTRNESWDDGPWVSSGRLATQPRRRKILDPCATQDSDDALTIHPPGRPRRARLLTA
ncbi:hypothetical protein KC351_g6 [Hortaea werneckii]|nr:hypothetical protein KC351_g6 [Hortaea werneckii]